LGLLAVGDGFVDLVGLFHACVWCQVEVQCGFDATPQNGVVISLSPRWIAGSRAVSSLPGTDVWISSISIHHVIRVPRSILPSLLNLDHMPCIERLCLYSQTSASPIRGTRLPSGESRVCARSQLPLCLVHVQGGDGGDDDKIT
jgi:hypothetical protein